MLRLQETSNDAFGSLIVSAAGDMPSMNVVMNGRDPSCVAGLLPRTIQGIKQLNIKGWTIDHDV